jgi:hypothetical protein
MNAFGRPPFEYSRIETQTIEAFPHLRPAAEEYWRYEGRPGEDSGPYIFFDTVVGAYFKILLAMPTGTTRNRLLAQGFEIIDEMLAGHAEVLEIAWVSLLEGQARWWLERARPFLGPIATKAFDEYEPWRLTATTDGTLEPPDEIIDLYGAGDVVLDQLRGEGTGAADVPGVRVPRGGRSLTSLAVARRDVDGVVLLSCFGTTDLYVVAPASEVACEHEALTSLAADLAHLGLLEPGETEPSEVGYYRIFVGERVWRMFGPDFAAAWRLGTARGAPGLVEHERWTGQTWISPFYPSGIHDRIHSVLSGLSTRL